jgi:hypothetical protein
VELGGVLDVVTVVVVAVAGAVVARLGPVAEKAAESGASRGATLAVEHVDWPNKLREELEKTRGTERQELRFAAYAKLWSRQRPLAIYDTSRLDPEAVAKLSNDLSDWYFSEQGGLLLTRHVRDFYFALQDLLRGVAAVPDWHAERSADDPETTFEAVLEDAGGTNALAALAYLDRFEGPTSELTIRDWPGKAHEHARLWRTDIGQLLAAWPGFEPSKRFAVLQQVASTLRTTMVLDVESRLR